MAHPFTSGVHETRYGRVPVIRWMIAPSRGSSVEKPIPLGVALGVMGAILIGGAGVIGYFLYWPARETKAMQVVVPAAGMPRVAGGIQVAVANPATARAIREAAADTELADGVYPRPGGEVLVKAGDAYLRARPVGGHVGYAFGFFTLGEAEWEHGYLTQGVRRVLAEEEFAREMKLTPEQRKALEALPASPLGKWTNAERERFAGLHRNWEAATGVEKEKVGEALVTALRTYAEGKRSEDQKVMAERVRRIKEVLTKEQLGKVNPIREWK